MRLSIQNKLFGGFGIAIALLVTVSVIAYIGLSSIAGASEDADRSELNRRERREARWAAPHLSPPIAAAP